MAIKSRSRLGRGLNSLISSMGSDGIEHKENNLKEGESPIADNPGTRSTAVETITEEVSIDTVKPNPHQPRRSFDEARLAELAESIKSSGLIQPIIVRSVLEGYELIAGERRLRAARLAGLTHIPVLVREADSIIQAQLALVENTQREDLNPVDRALAYRHLLEKLGLTQTELARRLGEERSSVANYLRLLDLSEPVRQGLQDGKLTMGHAKLLAGVPDILEQHRLADLVISQELSVRNLERLIETPQGLPETRSVETPTAHIADLEKTISRQLGMRVQVRSSGKKGKGRLVIHYGSLDQFDHLLAKLDVATE